MGILEDLEKLILPAEKLNADGVPSASLAILEDGKISAHVITNGQENVDTVYQAASISKAIIALAVAKLVDQERISYDTRAVDHLPQTTIDCLVDSKTAHLMEHVTVGMLLSHTSGLSQHGFSGYYRDVPSAEDVLSGRHPSNSPKVHFLYFPGAQYSYSGGGYTVLQLVLEHVIGISFPDIMKQVLFEPLGMTRSWYGDLPPNEKNFAQAYFTGYTKADAPYHRFVELAAAGLWTTPSDLLKAVSAIQESLYTDSGFLKQETAKKMLTEISKEDPGKGLGWGVSDLFFGHAGANVPGYNTYFFGSHGGIINSTEEDDSKRSKPRNGMINSALGHEAAIMQIISAIFFLKGWDRFYKLPLYSDNDDDVPYPAPEGTSIDEAWKQWIGKWDSDWELVDQNGPALAFQSFSPMKLMPGAAPVKSMKDGKYEFIFMVDGIKTGVRLTWEDNVQVLQLLHGEAKTLKRK